MGVTLERFARATLRRLNRALPAAPDGMAVLAYHRAGASTGAPVDLDSAVFRAQLDELAASRRVVSLDAALERLARQDDAGEVVVLTFDDAFRNFFEAAWPLLSERRLPAVLYVPVGFVEGDAPAPLTGAEHLPAMTWEQIREVAASGLVTIGSHGMQHRDLRRLSTRDCRRELEESRRRLEEEVGAAVTSFCYPRALWSRGVTALAAATYESAVAAGGRRNRPGRFDPHRISRLPVRRDMPPELSSVIDRSVWLEEWVAAGWRRLRP